MPPADPTRTRARRRRRSGPPTPASSQTRASLERQYRSLIGSDLRHPKFKGDLQIYKPEQIRRMGSSELSRLIRAAYRTPSFK